MDEMSRTQSIYRGNKCKNKKSVGKSKTKRPVGRPRYSWWVH